MTIKGLNHITFAVADIDRATEFYTQILGARLLVKGEKAVYMDLAGIWLALNLEPETKAAETY
ncbi:MAG TPA: metallothiol transferase FosB, partial [Firmicutes bacterium]|nr:metallothiol transferase FosB [Bacillota bacterium]